MTDEQNPKGPDDQKPDNAPAPTVESLQAEVDKWKALSRTNEKRWNEASTELDTFRQAQMTEQEKAIEAAKAEARTAALSEVGTSLVAAEIRAQAATAGVTVSTEFLDLNRFLGENGRADGDKVKSFISSLPKPTANPEFPQLMGAGHHQAGGNDISTMDPNELADIIANGSFI
ncbi:hypothetical protein [Streptomyces graminilatus]|uniref:hypothetical protein n=1 Tax=Streptomyces graminilatus TaxID=1464070 RepID=UPI0006E3F9F6|nr:hypothetical protein [Streptomyces graminilatus]